MYILHEISNTSVGEIDKKEIGKNKKL